MVGTSNKEPEGVVRGQVPGQVRQYQRAAVGHRGDAQHLVVGGGFLVHLHDGRAAGGQVDGIVDGEGTDGGANGKHAA